MLSTLTLRNVKRSSRDYLIYLVTMTVISSLMFAFHGMIFSNELRSLYRDSASFAGIVGLASFFIIFIVIWLVHYIVNFMLERRSREFGTYLLLGMEKQQIARIFRNENMIMAIMSMLLGVLPGFLFQKIFINVFYTILDVEYRISLDLGLWGVLITAAVLIFAFWRAMARVKGKFRKMHIREFIYMDKKNEPLINESSTWKKIYVFIAIAFIIYFNIMVFSGNMNTEISVLLHAIGLVTAVYLLYFGLASFFVDFIKRKNNMVYKDARIFVFRQLSSKIKTMRFTMGTLTILFVVTLLGWTVMMMFTDYQINESQKQVPFDVAIFSDKPDHTFEEQIQLIEENTGLANYHVYRIYENGTSVVNDYLYENIDWTSKGNTKNGKFTSSTYFGYDTYMKLSDYNYIRGMLGYEEVILDSGYILHGKLRILECLVEISETVPVKVGFQELTCREIRTEHISQNGINGADYIIVVPDELLLTASPYYSVMVGELETKASPDLQEKLDATYNYWDELTFEPLYDIKVGRGSNYILGISQDVIVAETALVDLNFVIVSMCFVLAYLGIVFLCAALAIMTVQQLSDASKYRFRYRILKQLGMNRKETEKTVLKQLSVYYLCPYMISIVLSVFIGMLTSERFVYYTGVEASDFQYFIMALQVFSVVYGVYFVVSYLGFTRNLEC